MNKKKLLFGSLVALGLFSVAALSFSDIFESNDKVEQKYSERDVNFLAPKTGAKDMQELMFELKKNVVTGELTMADYQNALAEINMLSSNNRNALLQWEELGPDNIGGRTRAIVVDNTDPSIIFAGSVSGGLWKSTNNANNWSQVLAFEENLGVSHMAQTSDGTLYIGTGHFQETSFGSEGSGYNGNGLYYTTDGGETVNHVAGTESYGIHKLAADTINNVVWMATSNGVKRYTAGGTVQDISVDGNTSFAPAIEISTDGSVLVTNMNSRTYVSTDGGNTWVNRSDNNLANPITSADVGRPEYAISHAKVDGEYYIYASLANSSNRIRGVWVSENNGQDWFEIAPSYQAQTQGGLQPVFAPFSTSLSAQGSYNNIITVDPTNPERTILGGIDLHEWTKAVDNPPFGSWEQKSFWFSSPTSEFYVHADNHELTWSPSNRLYIGNDGGVGVSDDLGDTYYPANKGYNVTQFYSIAFSAHGDVLGGTQDNGTLLNDFSMNSWQEFREVRGGDGFQCAYSFRNRNMIFSSIYYGSIERSDDRGLSWSGLLSNKITALGTPGQSLGSFFTTMELFEDPFDVNSTDTVKFVPARPYTSGEEVTISSFSSGDTLVTTLTQNIRFEDTVYYDPALTLQDTIVGYQDTLFLDLSTVNYSFIFGSHPMTIGDSLFINASDTLVVDSIKTYNHYFIINNGDIIDIGQDTVALDVAWDTIRVQDIRQSWLAFGLSGSNGVWITREATRFQAQPEWYKVADQYSGRVVKFEFSKDGEHLFFGTSTGQLWRVSGFNDVYKSTPRDTISKWIDLSENVTYPVKTKLTQTQIMGASGPITGICSDPQDPERLMVTVGGFGGSGKVRLSTTAASATSSSTTGSFQSKQGSTLPTIPAYSCIIDRDNPDFGIVGTEFGVWATENLSSGAPTWVECNDILGRVPVFDMGQAWRTWNEGARRPGEIYIATHGRGMFKSATLLNVPDMTEEKEETTVVDHLKVFPNPLRDFATVEFDLKTNADVKVRIYNLSGRLVREINESNMLAGKNQIRFNAGDLPNGTYIIQMQSGVTSKTAKFIKSK